MRKTLAVVALTASLTGGTAALAAPAFAAPQTAPVATQTGGEEAADGEESDKTGLLGLLGLLGLAGLAKRKDTAHNGTHTGVGPR